MTETMQAPTEAQPGTVEHALLGFAEVALRGQASPIPTDPEALGWQLIATRLAVTAARLMVELNKAAPERAAQAANRDAGSLVGGMHPVAATARVIDHVLEITAEPVRRVPGGGGLAPSAAGWPAQRPIRITTRELQVLRGAANGGTNAVIGLDLSLSEETVKTYMRSVLRKLRTRDRAQAVAVGMCLGVLSADDIRIPQAATPIWSVATATTRRGHS